MLQHNSETYSCFDMGNSELLINDVMLKVEPQSAEAHLTCLTAQHQRGQSRDTHVVMSHVLFTFCARLKVCLTIIFLVYGGVQK